MSVQVTKELATFITRSKLEDVPEEVRLHVKKCILDTICCGLFGSTRPEGRAIIKALNEMGIHLGSSSIWATPLKTDCGYAALANGIMVESFTMDDFHNRSIVHPGCVTVPAALSIVEWLGGASGKALLAAVICGYEIAIRVGMGISPSARLRGHHPVGICGPFGAAATAAKLLGLNQEQALAALGNAGSQGCGLMSAQFGFMTQRLHAGRANQSGILAAFLARNGFTGTTDILEAEYGGFCSTYADKWSLERITEGLGSYFEAGNVALRPYACAASVCTSVDAVKGLSEKHRINPKDVKEVVVTCNKSLALHSGWEYKPDTLISAQMNIPYGIAITLIEGDAGVDQYTEDKIHDPRIVDLCSKVRVLHDPELDDKGEPYAYYVRVHISTTKGQKYTSEIYWAKGTRENPLSDVELTSKCHYLADGVIGTTEVGRLMDLATNLEDVREVSELLMLLHCAEDCVRPAENNVGNGNHNA